MSSSNALAPPQTTRPSFFRSLSSSSSVNSLTSSIGPRKDKPRLFLALFPRGGTNLTSSYSSAITCDSYHWTLLLGSQNPSRDQPSTCFQIVHTGSSTTLSTPYPTSFYEETELSGQSQAQSQTLLARIALAKVVDENRLRSLLRSLPASSPPSSTRSSHGDSDYDTDDLDGTCTCLTWVKAAFKILLADTKCIRGYVAPQDWAEVEEVARMYLKKKRRQGRFGNNNGGQAIAEQLRFWKEDEVPTWNFWENRETTA